MKLIVGLGNPGNLYVNSRHNVGFLVVRTLAQAHKILLKKEKGILSLSGKGRIEGQNIILAMPLTFMNLSGVAVAGLLKRYKIDLSNLLVACDDLDLSLGRLKIKSSGSSGGHRGLKSIIESLKGDTFARLRIGIGRPARTDISAYVLSHFSKKEKVELSELIERASDCCRVWVAKGINKSMNIFNQRSKER
jgi:PTH1 family peptidyl-tRNA hydrolase